MTPSLAQELASIREREQEYRNASKLERLSFAPTLVERDIPNLLKIIDQQAQDVAELRWAACQAYRQMRQDGYHDDSVEELGEVLAKLEAQ